MGSFHFNWGVKFQTEMFDTERKLKSLGATFCNFLQKPQVGDFLDQLQNEEFENFGAFRDGKNPQVTT